MHWRRLKPVALIELPGAIRQPSHMSMHPLSVLSASVVSCFLLASCASTTVELSGAAPAGTLCQTAGESVNALLLWGPRWRPDQKDVPLREEAAERGIKQFFAQSGCYANTDIRRVSVEKPIAREQAQQLAAAANPKASRVLVLTVRELGPIVKLLTSAALIEGGTEVVLNVSYYNLAQSSSNHDFQFHWKNGGSGVIKGVATLPDDMRSALVVSLEPSTAPK